MNIQKTKFMVIVFFIILFFILGGYWGLKQINKDIIQIESTKENLNENYLIGEKGYISSAVITQRKTGTGPFDENDDIGNDSSEDNDIVRSFDQITWTLENTLKLKNEEMGISYQGGVIEVKAELSQDVAKYIKWDIESMKWAENVQISNDGSIFSAQYTLSDSEITVPGKQTLVFVIKVMGAPNGIDIKPKFTMNLQGNSEDEKFILEDSATKVSAAPNYNIKLSKNADLEYKTEVDYGNGNTKGRMYGYTAVLQLYNTNVNKGLKGIEYPQGDIDFNLDIELTRTKFNSTEREDITSECTPILWNYRENYESDDGVIEGRTMMFNNKLSKYNSKEPYGINTEDRSQSVYNSGNIVMTQNDNIISTRISNYEFDGEFPQYPIFRTATTIPIYSKNIGVFAVEYFQIFVPDNEASTVEGRNYYLKISDNNLKMKSVSGVEQEIQQVKTDDSLTTQHVIYRKGTFTHNLSIVKDKTNGNYLSKSGEAGDAKVVLGQYFELNSKFAISSTSEDNLKSATKFIKFDGNCVQPVLYSNGDKYNKKYFDGNMTFNVWYLTKRDGTNWSSQEEMNQAKIQDMLYYRSIEEIPENSICIGEFIESIDGDITTSTGTNNVISIRLKVKDTAQIGRTYGFTQTTTDWIDYIDRDIYSIEKENFAEWPECTWTSGERDYIKTEYDDSGEIIVGTHNGGSGFGQSVLVLGAELKIDKDAVDENNLTKENYDLGKNEYDVTYVITPTIVKNTYTTNKIKNINLKIEDKLPKGIKYISGTSNYEEPICTINEDGTTNLIWNLYNCTEGEQIEPIKYQAHIDEETQNGTQFINSAIVSENITEGEISKIGNAHISYRTATNTIQVINLESNSLHKTTNTPITEVNQQIHYRIYAINKTENPVSDFQMLDILPYNGDNRGTHFNGDYTVSRIELNQNDITTNNNISVSNFNIKITDDDSVRTSITAKDTDLGIGSMWTEINSSEAINQHAKGFVVIGELASRAKLEIDIYLDPNNNKATDKYNNSVTAQTNVETEVIQSPIIKVQVIKRTIEGKVWLDNNKNGIIDEDEPFLQGERLSLLNEDGTIAKNINNEEISSVETDDNGYYRFEDMKKGNYKVKIDYNDSSNQKEITKRGVGSNIEINNKFNYNCYTDLITELNSTSSPLINVKYINAGITYKDSKVIVHHYLEGTTNHVTLKNGLEAEDETINGKVEDVYNTSAVETQEFYELVNIPENASGRMKVEDTIVTYYYRYKKYPYIVKYIDKDTNQEIIPEKPGEELKYGTVINAQDEVININKYDFDSADKASLTIQTDNNQIILYYTKKKGTVTSKYIDINTNEEIGTEETTEGTVDSTYTTIKKNITGYTFVKDTENTSGKYTEEPINVIYYYKQNTKVIVNYIDKISGEILEKTTKDGLVGDEYTSISKDFESYILIEKPEIETVIMTPEDTILNYYYIHVSGGVIEKHVNIYTGEVLYNKEHSGHEGDEYNILPGDFENYELVTERLPSNSRGRMSKESEPIEVIYYYKYKTQLITRYIDKITGIQLTNETVEQGYEGDRYSTMEKSFENYTLVEVPENARGNLGKDPTIVIYYYVHDSAGVVINHYDDISGEKLKNEQIITGKQGDNYVTSEENFEGYDLVEEKKPENASGTMTVEQINVDYFYKYKTKVIVKYIDIMTGKEIANQYLITGHEQDKYESTAKEIDGYIFTNEIPENAEGIMTKDTIEVKYYYERPAKVIVSYIDIDTNKEIDERTVIEGNQNDLYSTQAKEIRKYKIVEDRYPENSDGKMIVTTDIDEDGKTIINDITYVKYYYKKLEANLKVNKEIKNIIINSKSKETNCDIEKIEINKKDILNTKIQVIYKICVENTGEVITDAILEENIPDGMKYSKEANNEWIEQDNNVIINIKGIKPKEIKEYLISLNWIPNESNMGTLRNQVKLTNVKNEYEIEETTRTDNLDSADLIVSISTGINKYIYVFVIISAMLTVLSLIIIKKSSKKE